MRICVAGERDTLRLIAEKYGFPLNAIIPINPHISHKDLQIPGTIVHLPEQPAFTSESVPLPFCAPAIPAKTMDQWLPLAPLAEMEQTEYDVLIIGTGAGGSAALWRLCEKLGTTNKRIGVIERGNLLLPSHALNVPTLWNWSLMLQYYYNPRITYPLGKTLPEFPGARQVFALGGRTLFWGFTSVRTPSFEFVNWPISYKELETYYNIAEQVMGVSLNSTSFNEVLLRRLWEGGYPESQLTPNAITYGDLNVFFSSIVFIGEALRHKAFDLAVNARAIQLVTEQGTISGVRVKSNNTPYFLKAKSVVVAGSTFETPRLLLHSKIPGKSIGHYLTTHSYLKSDGNIIQQNATEGEVSLLIPQTEQRPYQFKITGGREVVSLDVSGRVQSRYENRVYLDHDKKDEFGVPMIQVNFSYSQADQIVMQHMENEVRRVASVMEVSIPKNNCFWPPGYENHDFGTCRMGDDHSTSVTNRYGQVHNIPGLYVADSSVMPSIGAVNPMLTIVALAIRTADHILGRV